MYNLLQENKDETCSEEQVTPVREIIEDLKGSVLYSIWIYKIHHVVDENIMGYK